MATSVDNNIYAMSIQMQLESSDAFDTLDQFGDKMTSVEEQVSSSAQQALSSISDVSSQVDTSLGDVLSQTDAINSSSVDIGKSLQEVLTRIEDWGDLTPDELENFKKLVDYAEDLTEQLEAKNLVHEDELASVEKEKRLSDAVLERWENIATVVRETYRFVRGMTRAFANLMETIARANEIQEQFVENNYRLYGSMDGIAAEVRGLAREYGVLEKNAIEAYKSLADVRTPREEIDRLVTIAVKFNRVTGVGVKTVAEYTRQLRSIGVSAADTELHLNRMQDMMRKVGLNAEQMNKLLGSTETSMMKLEMLWGGEEGARYFKRMQGAAAGLAQTVGGSADEIMKQFELMNTSIEDLARQMHHAGVNEIHTAEDLQRVFLGAAETARDWRQGMIDAGKDSRFVMAEITAKYKSFGYASEEAMMSAIRIAEAMKDMGKTSENVGDLADFYDEVRKAMEDTWPATIRFAHAWKDLKEALGGIFREFWNLFGMIIVPMVKWLTIFANAIASVIGFLVQLYVAARKLPVLGWLLKWAEDIVVLLLAVAFVFGLAGAAMLGFAGIVTKVAAAWTGASTFLTAIGTAVTSVAAAIGNAMIALFASLGQAIGAFGVAIRPAMLPLLALGAALLMAGAGAYFFAKGIKILVGVPYSTIGAGLLMMAGAIVVLGGAATLLALTTGPVVPILWALGGAILMIGAAAWLMGTGLRMAAQAFQMIVDAIGPQSPPLWVKLPMVAYGLLAVSAAALISAPGLIVLAGIMVILAAASWMVGPPLAMISSALESLKPELITAFADALYSSAWKISLGVLALSPAIMAIAALSPFLLVAGVALLVSGAMFALAANMIGSSAAIFASGVRDLAESSKIFKDVEFTDMAYQLLVGGAMLGIAGIPFVAGATLVGLGALILGTGLSSLADGAKAFEGIAFSAMAKQLGKAAFWLAISGVAFVAGATLVGVGAFVLGGGLSILAMAAQQMSDINLSDVAYDLAIAGGLLARAALPLLFGANALMLSSTNLLIAGGLIAVGGSMLESGAAGVLAGAQDLYQVGDRLLWAGYALLTAGPMLLAGSSWLYVASASLMGASGMMIAAGLMLVPAATMMYIGMWWLESALNRFKNTIPIIDKVGDATLNLATGLQMLKDARFEALGEAADAGLAAIPKLRKFGAQLPAVATILSAATAKFKKPVDELAQVLNTLGDSITQFDGVGQSLAGEMEAVSGTLDEYSYRLEAAAERIQTAVDTKAGPAIAAADDSGLQEAVRSEAITQVQVTSDEEGSEKIADEQVGLATAQLELLTSINERLTIMSNADTSEILTLLQTYLPELTTRRGGLSSEMNNWMR
jgi:uncharacterized protein YukE